MTKIELDSNNKEIHNNSLKHCSENKTLVLILDLLQASCLPSNSTLLFN